MARADAEGVDIGAGAMDTKAVGAEGEEFGGGGMGDLFAIAFIEGGAFDPEVDEVVEGAKGFFTEEGFLVGFEEARTRKEGVEEARAGEVSF